MNKFSTIKNWLPVFFCLLWAASLCAIADEDAEAYAYYIEAQQAFENKHLNKAIRLIEQARAIRHSDQTLILNKQSRRRFYSGARGIKTFQDVDGDKVYYFPNRLKRQIDSALAESRVLADFEKKQQQPPEIVYFSRLVDQDNDGLFYEDEPLDLYIHIRNEGKGTAENLIITLKEDSGLKALSFKREITRLKPGESKIISVNFSLPREYNEPELMAKVSIDEKDGFSPKPLEISYQIQPWTPPKLEIVIKKFPPLLTAGRSQEYEYVLRNVGTTPARNFALRSEINMPGLSVISESWPDHFSLFKAGNELNLGVMLKANIDIETTNAHQLEWVFEDKYLMGQVDRFKKLASFDLPVGPADRQFQIENYYAQSKVRAPGMVAGILPPETLIPARLINNKHRHKDNFALIIGNRDYVKAKNQPVLFALKDAILMTDVFTHNMGIPRQNVYKYQNITLGEMNTMLGEAGEPGQFQNIINQPNKQADTVYVYYSGHGVPSMNKAWSAYLMPVDANPYYIDKSGYSLDVFYKQLSLIKAKRIVVFLDACFSGNSASGSLFPETSTGLLKTPTIPLPEKDSRITVFSATDSQGVALWFNETGHGLFTHFLAKGLSGVADDGDKTLNLKELYQYVHNNVIRVSSLKERFQSPSIYQRANLELVRYEF